MMHIVKYFNGNDILGMAKSKEMLATHGQKHLGFLYDLEAMFASDFIELSLESCLFPYPLL